MSKKKKQKLKKKLKTFYVPVTVTISGQETVKAKNWKDAIKKARKQYFKQDRDKYGHGVPDSCIYVDFAEYEDEVEVDDEQKI